MEGSMEKHKLGIIAGSFDVIHPGYIRLFEDAKRRCEIVAVALNTKPEGKSIVFSMEDRTLVLSGMRDVDFVMGYGDKSGLVAIFKMHPRALRIVGSDYDPDNLPDLGVKNQVYYHQRSHDWSATKYKQMIEGSFEGA